jgi:hypothetical protein
MTHEWHSNTNFNDDFIVNAHTHLAWMPTHFLSIW